MFTSVIKSMFGKAVLAAVVVGGALCFAGASNAQADERDRDRVHEDVIHRGFYSPRAAYWRHERREAFARGYYDRFGCWHRY
jgi:hypothetical protein